MCPAERRIPLIACDDCGDSRFADTRVPDHYAAAWFCARASWSAIFHALCTFNKSTLAGAIVNLRLLRKYQPLSLFSGTRASKFLEICQVKARDIGPSPYVLTKARGGGKATRGRVRIPKLSRNEQRLGALFKLSGYCDAIDLFAGFNPDPSSF
jgi:hypothetical protein